MSQYINKIRTDKGDLQIDYNALANLPTISNPNLLINSDFRNPINQRGQTTYAPSRNILAYTIDRWGIFPSTNEGEGHTLTVNDGYITFANTNENMSAYLIQHLEQPLSGIYTISVKVKSATKAFNLSYRDNGTTYGAMTLNTGVNYVTIECTSLDFIRFGISSTASVDIEWVKLEVGATATAFSPRPYAEEVVLCKRFFQSVNLYWRPGMVNSAGTVISFAADVLLRTLPSGSPLVTLYEVPTRIRTTSSNSVDTTLTLESVYLANSMVVLNIASSTGLEARSMAVPVDAFKVYVDAEIY